MSQLVALPSFELLLIVGRAITLVGALLIFAWSFRHWRRAALRDTQRVFEQLDLVRSELLIMKEAMRSTARRPNNEPRVSPVANNNAARGYEIAARLARNGAKQEELMRTCGITIHEAELLVKLHGQKNAQATPPSSMQTPRSMGATATHAQSAKSSVASAAVKSQPLNPATESPASVRSNGTASTQPKVPMKPRSRLMAVG